MSRMTARSCLDGFTTSYTTFNPHYTIHTSYPSTVLYHIKGLPVNLQCHTHSCMIYTATTVPQMFHLHLPHTCNRSTYQFQVKKTRQFLKSWLFWHITQHWLVANCQCFRTAKCWQLTTDTKPCKIPEEQTFHLHRSLKSCVRQFHSFFWGGGTKKPDGTRSLSRG